MKRSRECLVIFGLLALAIIAVTRRLVEAADDDAYRAAQAENLIARADKLYLPPLERLSWNEYQDRTNLPYQREQELYRRQMAAMPSTPDGRTAATRLSYEFFDRQGAKYLELSLRAIAARNFTYARNFIGYIPAGYWSGTDGQMVVEEKFLDRKRQATKLLYGTYLEAHEYVNRQLITFAQRMSQKRWSCPASAKADGNVAVWIDYADPRALLDKSVQENVAEWQRFFGELDSTACLRRTQDAPRFPHWSPRNFVWKVVRTPHKHYPEQGYLGVSITGLYNSDSAIDYLRTELRSGAINREDYPNLQVSSGRNWALFLNAGPAGTQSTRVVLLFVRTPLGYFYIGVHNNLPTGLEREPAQGVKDQMLRLAAQELVQLLAGDIPAEPLESAAELPSRQLSLTALDDVELIPTPDKPATCRLQVDLRDAHGAPLAAVRIAFSEPELGTVSERVVSTGANGKAVVTYTSPSVEQLARLARKEHAQFLRAVEPVSGASDYITLTTRRIVRRLAIERRPQAPSPLTTDSHELLNRTLPLTVKLLDEQGKPLKLAGERILLVRPVCGRLVVGSGALDLAYEGPASILCAKTDVSGEVDLNFVAPSFAELKALDQHVVRFLRPWLVAVDKRSGAVAMLQAQIANRLFQSPIASFDELWKKVGRHWVDGQGAVVTWNDAWLAEYMMANEHLPTNDDLPRKGFTSADFPSPQLELDRDVQRRFAQAQSGAVEIGIANVIVSDNGYKTGWDLLHGSNSDWNDDSVPEGPGFLMQGEALYSETEYYQQVDYRLTCTWKDRMDLESRTYWKDLALEVGKRIYNLTAQTLQFDERITDFNVQINWPVTCTVRKYKDGTVEYQGWPFIHARVDSHSLPQPGANAPKPGVRVLSESVRPGGVVVVRFTAGPGFAKNAWIGVIPASVPHGAQRPNDDADIVYQSLDGSTSGVLSLRIPNKAPPGEYQCRLFPSDDDAQPEAAHSATFTIQ